MFDFDNDGDFDLEDLIEADIEYGLFEEDGKVIDFKRKNLNEINQKYFYEIYL